MNTADRITRLREKANDLPPSPGVYIMKRADGTIIYVGKSRRLPARVSSYFSGRVASVKTARMVSEVQDFDYILCQTEIEALTLENLLIKKHTPKYNIKLKDAKSYPYLKITNEAYPRLVITRDRRSDGGSYFGPYSGMSVAKSIEETLVRLFRLPTCRRRFPEDIGRERPCIYRQMGRCMAPCTGEVTREEHLLAIKRAERVLKGHAGEVTAELDARMREEAERENFELAAYYRDSLIALKNLSEKQKVVGDGRQNADVFAISEGETVTVLSRLSVREGKLLSKNDYLFGAAELWEGEALTAFIHSLYEGSADIPAELLLGIDSEEEELSALSDALSLTATRRITVRTPLRGKGRALVEMARENAAERVRRYEADSLRDDETLVKLASLLALEAVPDRIEAYDVSNLGNEQITVSMAVCLKGKLAKSHYRYFRIDRDKADDYASMREALDRRLSHIGDGSPSFGERPDLILLDGGIGHVHTVKALLAERGIEIPVFGMIKDGSHKTRVLTDGEHEIQIVKDRALFTLVYRIQEEAHRFAISRMSEAKRKTIRRSPLESLPGIGPAKSAALYAAFGSLKRMREAERESIALVKGITEENARVVWEYLTEKTRKKDGES